MPRYEYKITAQADPARIMCWVIRVWMRDTGEVPGPWRQVIVMDYTGDLRDELRPRAVFKGIARCLS
jgi:hypothetical protein